MTITKQKDKESKQTNKQTNKQQCKQREQIIEGKDHEIDRLNLDISRKQQQISAYESSHQSDMAALMEEMQAKDSKAQQAMEKQYQSKLNAARIAYQRQIEELQAKNNYLAETAEQLATENEYWKEQSFAATFADELNNSAAGSGSSGASGLSLGDIGSNSNNVDLYGTAGAATGAVGAAGAGAGAKGMNAGNFGRASAFGGSAGAFGNSYGGFASHSRARNDTRFVMPMQRQESEVQTVKAPPSKVGPLEDDDAQSDSSDTIYDAHGNRQETPPLQFHRLNSTETIEPQNSSVQDLKQVCL